MRVKKCKRCGNDFEPVRGNAKENFCELCKALNMLDDPNLTHEEWHKKIMQFASLVLVALSVALTNVPMAPTVWISGTNVVGKSTGSKKYPLDGSTADRFDTLHRGFPPSSTINYFSNHVYQTTGSASYNDASGWWVKPGWKVRGHGATVRQVWFPSEPVTHGLFEMRMDDEGAEISDLTIDENWTGNPLGKSFSVSLWGSNCKIVNVRAVHGYGNRSSLMESFSLSISTYPGRTATNGLIDGCMVEGYRGNYGCAIALTTSGKVRNCIVMDFNGTSPIGLWSNVLYENNTFLNCFNGYYADTGTVTNFVIRNCHVLNGRGYAVHINPILGELPLVMGMLIEGCAFETSGIGVAMSGSLGPGTQYDFTIKKNTFTGKGLPIVSAYVQGLTVTDNLVMGGAARSVLNWPEYPSHDVTAARNYRLPAPEGLEESETGKE